MLEPEIYLVTKNPLKLSSAKKVFSKYGIKVKSSPKDYLEFQADSSREIALSISKQAAREFRSNALREDTSLFINALGGFPGPYMDYFKRKISPEKILELLKNQQDRSGYFEIWAVYSKPNGETKEFSFKIPIIISDILKGEKGSWEKFLLYENSSKAFSECSEDEYLDVWNKNFTSIAEEMVREKEEILGKSSELVLSESSN